LRFRPSKPKAGFLEYSGFVKVEPDAPDLVVEGFKTDDVSAHCVGDENISGVPPHLTSLGNAAHLPSAGIFGLPGAFRIWSRRRGIEAGRRFLAERLMGALFVVLFAEPVESLLLAATVGGRRRGRFLFEGTVHSFVPSVLLRLAGLRGF
jgi:hypothetical protein